MMLPTFLSTQSTLLLIIAIATVSTSTKASFITKRANVLPDTPETKAFNDCLFIALDENQKPKVQVDQTIQRIVFEPNGSDKDSYIGHARNGKDQFTLKVVDHKLHLKSIVPELNGLRMFEIKTSNAKWSYVWLKDNDECESVVGQNMPYFGSDVEEVFVTTLGAP